VNSWEGTDAASMNMTFGGKMVCSLTNGKEIGYNRTALTMKAKSAVMESVRGCRRLFSTLRKEKMRE